MTSARPVLQWNASRPERATLSGAVNSDTAGDLLEAGRGWLATLPAGTSAELELSAVGRCDSAALALLLDWVRAAAAADCSLIIRHVPAALQAMLPLLGLDVLLQSAGTDALQVAPRVDPAPSGTMPGSASPGRAQT